MWQGGTVVATREINSAIAGPSFLDVSETNQANKLASTVFNVSP